MAFKLTSPAFKANEAIPTKHTADGQDSSPLLSWSEAPVGTVEYALIVDDPDAPTPEPWVHWIVYKIPGTAHELPERAIYTEQLQHPAGALQGTNSWGKIGYAGPSPPRGHGVHHYHFKLYALNAPLRERAGLTKRELLAAMQGKIISETKLVGTYHRGQPPR